MPDPGLRALSGLCASARSKVAGAAFAVLAALIGTQGYYARLALRSEAAFPETRQDRLDALMLGALCRGDPDMAAALTALQARTGGAGS